jgi:hypothetical protein
MSSVAMMTANSKRPVGLEGESGVDSAALFLCSGIATSVVQVPLPSGARATSVQLCRVPDPVSINCCEAARSLDELSDFATHYPRLWLYL